MRAARSRTLARGSVSERLDVIEQGFLGIIGGGPELALAARGAADPAQENARQHVHRYEPDELPMGAWNALRHCTWAALVMRAALLEESRPWHGISVSPLAGNRRPATARDRARAVLLAHEPWGRHIPSHEAADTRIDRHNNEVGMQIAERLHREHRLTPIAACYAARLALDDGRLRIFDNAGRTVPSRSWRAIAQQRRELQDQEQERKTGRHGATMLPPRN
jgi:hypothetical protein